MKRILVAAGLIRGAPDTADADRYLISRRPAGTHLADWWEFPGGKLESGEAPAEALVRELREELGVEVEVGDVFAVGHHAYPEREVVLLVYDARIIGGEPTCREVAEFRWVTAAELIALELPPADRPVIDRLRRERVA
ncbi:MAG: 8-oxo-dGTP diphosphatase MutT [Myxococcales bacterium]|nr:8-oxo-dGTP diphosphatase MutT [Myxococcales bacterium]